MRRVGAVVLRGGHVLTVPASAGELRVLRIVTVESPSWVAWRELTLVHASG